MGKIAIGVVALPDERMRDYAIARNYGHNMVKGDEEITLAYDDFFPHISLCRGVAEESDIEGVEQIVSGIVSKYRPFTLGVKGFSENSVPCGRKFLVLDFYYDDKFKEFQQEIMEGLEDKLIYDDVSVDMFVDPDNVHSEAILATQNYVKKKGHPELYHPHMTIATVADGDLIYLEEPKFRGFISSEIGIFQLGNWSTCRRFFGSYDLVSDK